MAHQEVEYVCAGDGRSYVVPLQRSPLVLLGVRPRAVRQLQNEHLARLHTPLRLLGNGCRDTHLRNSTTGATLAAGGLGSAQRPKP